MAVPSRHERLSDVPMEDGRERVPRFSGQVHTSHTIRLTQIRSNVSPLLSHDTHTQIKKKKNY